MLKLSIITINLNNKEGLEKTLDSITHQNFKKYELIVIDGLSNDGSIEIIKKHSSEINYWVSETDNGIYHAMNKGIRQAKGEYCFFLNSGDYFTDKEVLLKVFENNISEDVIQGNLLVCLNNKIIGKSRGKKKLTFFDIYSSDIKHQATFIRRELFTKFGSFNEEFKIVSDWEFFMKTVGLGNASYRYIDIDISYYDNNGLSNNSESDTLIESQMLIDKYMPELLKEDYELLSVFKKFEILTKYKFSFYLLRLLSKAAKVYSKVFHNQK